MDLSDIGDFAKKLIELGLPILGAAVPIPGGEMLATGLAQAIGATDKTPSGILAKLADSTALAQARQFELTHQKDMLALKLKFDAAQLAAQAKADAADASQVAAVNTTMTAEANNAQAESWFQKGWRPVCGYLLGMTSTACALGVMLLFYNAMHAPNAAQQVAAVTAMVPALCQAIAFLLTPLGAAVGVTAWHRGLLQRQQAANAAGGGDSTNPSSFAPPRAAK